MKKFKLIFRSGVERVFEGENIEDACNRQGYSKYLLEDIEWCEEIEEKSNPKPPQRILIEGVVRKEGEHGEEYYFVDTGIHKWYPVGDPFWNLDFENWVDKKIRLSLSEV